MTITITVFDSDTETQEVIEVKADGLREEFEQEQGRRRAAELALWKANELMTVLDSATRNVPAEASVDDALAMLRGPIAALRGALGSHALHVGEDS